MKKAATPRALRPICAVLAAVFCFSATLLFFLYTVQIRFGGDFKDPQQRSRIFVPLLDIYCEELTDVFQVYYRSEGTEFADCPEDLLPQNTNLRLVARDTASGKLLLRTVAEIPQDDNALLQEIRTLHVAYTLRNDYLSEYEASATVAFYLPQTLPTDDSFSRTQSLMFLGAAAQPYLWAGGVLFSAAGLLCFFLFLRSAYREGGQSRSRHRLFREIPPDLLLVCLLPACLLCIAVLRRQQTESLLLQLLYRADSVLWVLHIPLACTGLFLVLLLWLSVCIFSLRQYGARGMLTYLRYEKAAFTRKTIPALFLLQLLKAVLLSVYADAHPRAVVLCLALEKIIALPVLYRCLRELHTIAEDTEAVAAGDLAHPIGTEHMYTSLRAHAGDIHSIAQRISLSADEYIRSGQFKTELITNLSHDIKTPLTSIINYAALLQDDSLPAQDKTRYIAVLHRHAERLSRLVEDLTQVSDTQAGKIEAHPTRLDLTDLVMRSALGFEERLQKQNIAMAFSVPEAPVAVWADSRLLWRVADNLMNNICKYTAPDTTVQITVSAQNGVGSAVYQNVPALPPGKTADALMERFVRADNSRHTEGSGLGLSIAHSLMKLQDGTLTLHASPDRFTAQITLHEKEG